jgi:hypothetical protein
MRVGGGSEKQIRQARKHEFFKNMKKKKNENQNFREKK